MTVKSVVVLDYGSGNLRSAQRALERVGATVEVTSDPAAAANADGLVVPGVGAYEEDGQNQERNEVHLSNPHSGALEAKCSP